MADLIKTFQTAAYEFISLFIPPNLSKNLHKKLCKHYYGLLYNKLNDIYQKYGNFNTKTVADIVGPNYKIIPDETIEILIDRYYDGITESIIDIFGVPPAWEDAVDIADEANIMQYDEFKTMYNLFLQINPIK